MKRVLLALVVLAACAPVDPQARAAADWNDCIERPDPVRQIEACGGVIENTNETPDRRAAALIQRATLHSNDGQYARAIGDLGRALKLSPENAAAHIERGQIHLSRGAYDDALRAVEVALTIAPSSPAALELRERLIAERRLNGQGEIEQASEALAGDPRNAELLNERCWLRAMEGAELDLALVDCNAALAADPGFAAAFDSRGLVQLKRGALLEALADYERALKIEPGRGHYLYGRGLVRIALGEKAAGESDLAAAEIAEPGVAALYRSYGVGG